MLGFNVILAADDTITMSDLTTDGVLQGGSGNISLSVLGDGSADGIFFDDLTNTIRTTSGDIILDAAAGTGTASSLGAVNVGNLETTANFGNITITAGAGGIQVASIETGGSGIQYPGDVSLTTINSGNITTGPITITASGNSNASAYLSINADGNLTVNGNILVSAYAQSAGSSTVYADAAAGILAGGNIDLTGNVTVEATAVNYAANGDNATASANLDVTALTGDLTVTGNINVTAYAIQTSLAILGSSNAYADAYANLYAPSNITVNGNVTVTADAINAAALGSNATALAGLHATAGTGERGRDIRNRQCYGYGRRKPAVLQHESWHCLCLCFGQLRHLWVRGSGHRRQPNRNR